MNGETRSDTEIFEALEEFLLGIMERLPTDLEEQTKALQQEIEMLKTQIARAKRQTQSVLASFERIDQIVGYFVTIAHALGDSSMLATVIRPLVHKMRELADKGELNVGFTDEEWTRDIGSKDS